MLIKFFVDSYISLREFTLCRCIVGVPSSKLQPICFHLALFFIHFIFYFKVFSSLRATSNLADVSYDQVKQERRKKI